MAEAKVKAATKSAIYQELSDKTGLSKKQVDSVFVALSDVIKNELGKKGPGIVTIPGLLKLKLKKKPATKAHPGRNPFTGAEIMVKAKPAHNVVKAYPLKSLKEMVK